MLFQQLYNMVDAIVVGRAAGYEALAAVGGSPAVILELVLGIFAGLSSGTSVIVSQCCGAHEHKRLSDAVQKLGMFKVVQVVPAARRRRHRAGQGVHAVGDLRAAYLCGYHRAVCRLFAHLFSRLCADAAVQCRVGHFARCG